MAQVSRRADAAAAYAALQVYAINFRTLQQVNLKTQYARPVNRTQVATPALTPPATAPLVPSALPQQQATGATDGVDWAVSTFVMLILHMTRA